MLKEVIRKPENVITLSADDFGLLCLCSIRYSQDKSTYMPIYVQNLVVEHLHEIEDDDLEAIIGECINQAAEDLYGDTESKVRWMQFRMIVERERRRRLDNAAAHS